MTDAPMNEDYELPKHMNWEKVIAHLEEAGNRIQWSSPSSEATAIFEVKKGICRELARALRAGLAEDA